MSNTLTVHPSTASKSSTVQFPHLHQIFEDMERLTRRISERAYNLFQLRGAHDGHAWDDWFKAESEVLKAIPIEISETDAQFTVRAEVPGFKAEELTIQAERYGVSIHGKSEKKTEKTEKGEVTYSEVTSNEVARRIELPSSIDSDHCTAKLTDGVLELTLPKIAPAKPTQVKVA